MISLIASRYKTFDEPYRIFFPCAGLLAIWGAFVWVLFSLNILQQYPRDSHAVFMISGFLNLFASGFLMTAIPRMTKTFGPTLPEIAIVLLPILALPLFVFSTFSFDLILTSQLGLLFFLFIRFKNKSTTLPPAFMFVGIGVVGSIAGLVLLIIGQKFANPYLLVVGRLFHFQMYMMSLVIGVGSKLVPWLLGYTQQAPNQSVTEKSIFINSVFAVCFLASYLIEASDFKQFAYAFRAFVVTLFFIFRWKIYKLPINKTGLAWSLWISCWSIVLGLWGSVAAPHLHIAFLHIVMIAGLAQMTFLISTRVILSHGGYDLNLERNKVPYVLLTTFLILTSLTRFAANMSSQLYLSHLGYAAMLWIFAVILWWWKFGLKAVFINEKGRGSC